MANAYSRLLQVFILRARPYRETSMLIDFFSRENGRVAAIARGVRKGKSAKSGLLLPFLPLCASFSGKSELLNLQMVEAFGPDVSLSDKAIFYGLYVNELLYRLLHKDDPHPGLFDAYQDFLRRLHEAQSDMPMQRDVKQRWALCIFKKQLLQEIGYGVEWHKTLVSLPVQENCRYDFRFGAGFIEVEKVCFGQRFNLPRAVSGKSLLLLSGRQNEHGVHELDLAAIINDLDSVFNVVFYQLLGDKFLRCRKFLNLAAC